jgi:hypothetical protein
MSGKPVKKIELDEFGFALELMSDDALKIYSRKDCLPVIYTKDEAILIMKGIDKIYDRYDL